MMPFKRNVVHTTGGRVRVFLMEAWMLHADLLTGGGAIKSIKIFRAAATNFFAKLCKTG